MKMNLKMKIATLAMILMVGFTVNSYGWGKPQPPSNPGCKPKKPPVGAPLDGGILIALVGAGAAYVAFRKKKKKEN